MSGWHDNPWRRAALAAGLAAVLAAGCTRWSVRDSPPGVVLRTDRPEQMRLTLADGARVELRSPRLSGDSLLGLSTHGVRLAVPTDEVRQVEVRTTNTAGTVALVGLGVGAVLVAIAAASGGDDDGPETPPPPYDPNEPWSCPLVYSWDGEAWRLDSGTFGGAVARPLARTDVDGLEHARDVGGEVRLRLSAELDETDYVDALELLAVDHPRGTTVAPDGRGDLHVLGALRAPLAARDLNGRDALERVRSADGWSWESALAPRDTTDPRDLRDGLELEFARPVGSDRARLVLDAHNTVWAASMVGEYMRLHGDGLEAWHSSLEADPGRAARIGHRFAEEGFLAVSVETEDGFERQDLVWEAGPEVVKRQVAVLDLSRVRGDRVRVRLESVPSFWLVDRAALEFGDGGPAAIHALAPESARTTDGRDVAPLLAAIDGREHVMERGDAAEVVYRVPPRAPGAERSYVLRSSGWYRIHASRPGAPDAETLARIESEPGSIARLAVARANAALSVLAAGGAW